MNCVACVVTENYLGYFMLLYNSIKTNWPELLEYPFYVITIKPWMSENAERLLNKFCDVKIIYADEDLYIQYDKRMPHYLRYEIHHSLGEYDKCFCLGADQLVLAPCPELFSFPDNKACFVFDDKDNLIGGSEVFPKIFLTDDYFYQLMNLPNSNFFDMDGHREVFFKEQTLQKIDYKYNFHAQLEPLDIMIKNNRKIIHFVYKFQAIKYNDVSVIDYTKQFDISDELENINDRFLPKTWW